MREHVWEYDVGSGPPGRMQMLHHGFTSDTDDGGFSLISAQRSLGECPYCKIVPKAAVTEPIKITQGRRVTTTSCLTLATMLAAMMGDAFKGLEAQEKMTLHQKPNQPPRDPPGSAPHDDRRRRQHFKQRPWQSRSSSTWSACTQMMMEKRTTSESAIL